MQLTRKARGVRGAHPPAFTSAVLLDRLPPSVAEEVRRDPGRSAAAEAAAEELALAMDKGEAISRLGGTPFAGWLTGQGIDASALALMVQMAR
jgi:hypothetical protein